MYTARADKYYHRNATNW